MRHQLHTILTTVSVLAFSGLCHGQTITDLNQASAFYGNWQGEIVFPSFSKGRDMQFQLAKAKSADKILFITKPSEGGKKADTTLCDFSDGIVELRMEGKGAAGNACDGVLQFSLLDTNNMTASYVTEATNCEGISFRGNRISGPSPDPKANDKPASVVSSNPKSGRPNCIDPCAPTHLKTCTWSSCSDLSAQEKTKRFGKGRASITKTVKTGSGVNDYTYELRLDNGTRKAVGPILNDKNKSWIKEFLGMDENTNAFVFSLHEQESNWVILINRRTGNILGSIDWYNEGAVQDFSPDKKHLVTYVSGLEGDCTGGCQSLYVYAIGERISEVFLHDFDDAANWWTPGSWRWLTNSVLEIDKMKLKTGKKPNAQGEYPATEDLQPGGKVWLVKTNGKWAFANRKPPL